MRKAAVINRAAAAEEPLAWDDDDEALTKELEARSKQENSQNLSPVKDLTDLDKWEDVGEDKITTDNLNVKVKKQENVLQDIVPPPSVFGKKVVEIIENISTPKVDTTIATNEVTKLEIIETIEHKVTQVEQSENTENITENKDIESQQDIISVEKTEPKQLQVAVSVSPPLAHTSPRSITTENNPAPKIDPAPTTTQKDATTDDGWSEWE